MFSSNNDKEDKQTSIQMSRNTIQLELDESKIEIETYEIAQEQKNIEKTKTLIHECEKDFEIFYRSLESIETITEEQFNTVKDLELKVESAKEKIKQREAKINQRLIQLEQSKKNLEQHSKQHVKDLEERAFAYMRRLVDPALKVVDFNKAVKNNDIAAVNNWLLDADILSEIRNKDPWGDTALHIAAYFGYVIIVESLLKAGVYIDALSSHGSSALHKAALKGQRDVIKLLVSHGADVTLQRCDDKTAEDLVKENLTLGTDEEIIKLLHFEKGREKILTPEEKTDKFIHAITYNHRNIVEKMLSDPDIKPYSKRHDDMPFMSALIYAAWHQSVEVADCLLKAGAYVDECDRSFCTALHTAVYRRNEKLMALLLEAGADINKANANGNTPLHTAVNVCSRNAVKFLLSWGADATIRNKAGKTPLDITKEYSEADQEITDMLSKKLDSRERFINAIKSNNKDGVQKLLLDPEIKTYLRDKNLFPQTQYPALVFAVYRKRFDIVKCLVDAKAALNSSTIDDDTALHVAASNGDTKIMQCLLDAGASKNLMNKNGDTPLHIAVRKGHKEVIKMLTHRRADIDIKNKDGLMPLDLAKKHSILNQDRQVMGLLKPFSMGALLPAVFKRGN